MPISMHNASVPVFTQVLGALEAVLDKAEAHATTRKIAPETILHARLYPDMFHLTRQVQIACDFAMKTTARLAGVEPPKVEDTEKTFAEIKARVNRARDYVKAADAKAIDASADRDISFPTAGTTLTMTGVKYLNHFAMPNFYFHTTMAYAILRENGLELGKRDFLGAFTG